VDDYQGQEERVVFISTVVSRPPPAPRVAQPAGATQSSAPGSSAAAAVSAVAAIQLGFLACPRQGIVHNTFLCQLART